MVNSAQIVAPISHAQYDLIRTTDQLRAFVPAWSALWNADTEATPFHRPEWLMPWWHHFGQSELRAVIISQRDEPVGFLPFYVYSNPENGERQLLLLGVGTTDYLNGIFAPECTIERIQGAVKTVCADDGWDVLYASQILPDTKLARALETFTGATRGTFAGESCSRMPAVAISELPQKIRRNAMYYRNRALRLGSLELSIADASNWSEAFDALVRLHSARWQARGEAGVLADARVLAWHREALPQLERSGNLRLCSLRLNDEIIGVLYSLIDPPDRLPRTQYFYLTAYSNEHAELRPGTLLLAFAIETAAREGVQTIDMLRGEEAYKQNWHLERFPTCGFVLHPQR